MDRSGKQAHGRRLAGSILIILPGLAVAMSSIVKFAGVPAVVHQMAAQGFAGGKLTLVAALEILSAVLFLFPRTRSFGVLLLSSFLGGAICTHVRMGEYAKAIGPFILMILAWVGTWLRHPDALWSFTSYDAGVTPMIETRGESWASKSV